MKKKLSIIIIISSLQLTLSCKSQYDITELKNNFTAEQINDLKKITDFFKNQMCLGMESDFETCYKRTPHEYLEAIGKGFWNNIDFEKQNDLYNEISKATFNEIWSFCKSKYPESGIELTELCSKYKGKYQEYLLQYGQTNNSIQKYADRVTGSGGFSLFQLTHWQILKNKKDFDLKDPNIQLIISIHYLSINDEEKRNEKPKLKLPKL